MEVDEVMDTIQFCMEKNKGLGKYNFKYNFIQDNGVERICEIMAIADHVFEVEAIVWVDGLANKLTAESCDIILEQLEHYDRRTCHNVSADSTAALIIAHG